MPVRIGLKPNHARERLANLECALQQELESPQESGPGPLIIIDPGTGGLKRVFVIWNDWSGINMEDRADVILSAYRKAASDPDDYLSVSMVMGLTPDEAPKFGIHPEDYASRV